MSVFDQVAALRPKRNFFNLSHNKKFDCDMGQLIPILCEECYPGDKFKISNECIVRMQPLVSPVLHEIYVKTEYFFVPFRLLWDDWTDFFTGGVDGEDSHTIPIWDDYKVQAVSVETVAPPRYSLWDYFNFPLVSPTSDDLCPIAFPRTAYNLIWNEYYRDENIDSEVALDNNSVLYRRWNKDYFTSALPFQQRGVSPALPIFGNAPVVWGEASTSFGSVNTDKDGLQVFGKSGFTPQGVYLGAGSAGGQTNTGADVGNRIGIGFQVGGSTTKYGLDADLASVTAGNIADLRLAFQIQKYLERNARAGVRYPEFLLAHYGVSPKDSRLQRPEFLGGSKSPLLISEVLQTSETTVNSPQGSLAGRGIGASANYIAQYSVPEPGYIIGLFSIQPVGGYTSQGIDKKFLRRSKYDFYSPEFAHLSEQPIKNVELFMSTNDDDNKATFGYQGIFDELRYERNQVAGLMRDDDDGGFGFWHLNRIFKEATKPALNSDFLECNPSKRIFAVQDEPGFIVDFQNVIKALRPLPKLAEPGLVDHF